MIGQATAHRRANAFARALEAAGAGADGTPSPNGATDAADPRQGRLLATARALADVPGPTLDPEVKTVQRARLVAAMEAASADGSLSPAPPAGPATAAGRTPAHRARGGLRAPRPRTRWSRRLAAGGLTVGVAAGAFSGVAAASTNALPGDTLYGLKRGMEDLRLGMAGDDADRGTLLLGMAGTRLQEARRLMDRRRAGALDPGALDEVRGALLGMHNEAAEGHQLLSAAYRRDGSLTPIETLDDFSRRQRLTWAQLRHQLPPQLSGLSAKVSRVFAAIDREVAPLRGLLPPAGGQVRSPGATHGTAGARHGASAGPSDPGATDRPGRPAHGGVSPSAATTTGQGFIGGSGLLPPPTGAGSPSAGGSGAPGGTDGRGRPDVSLPPLLPDLLPGIGISGGDEER